MMKRLSLNKDKNIDSVCFTDKQFKQHSLHIKFPKYLVILSNDKKEFDEFVKKLSKSKTLATPIKDGQLFFVSENVIRNVEFGYSFNDGVCELKKLYERHDNTNSNCYYRVEEHLECMLMEMLGDISVFFSNLCAKTIEISCTNNIASKISEKFNFNLNVLERGYGGSAEHGNSSGSKLQLFYKEVNTTPVFQPFIDNEINEFWIKKAGQSRFLDQQRAQPFLHSDSRQFRFIYDNNRDASLKYSLKVTEHGVGVDAGRDSTNNQTSKIEFDIKIEFFTTNDLIGVPKRDTSIGKYQYPRSDTNQIIDLVKQSAQEILFKRPDTLKSYTHSCMFLVFGPPGAGKSSFIRSCKIAFGGMFGYLDKAYSNTQVPKYMSFRTDDGTRGTKDVRSYPIFSFEHERDGTTFNGDVQFIDTAGFTLKNSDLDDIKKLKELYNGWVNPQPNLQAIRPDGAVFVLDGLELYDQLQRRGKDFTLETIEPYQKMIKMFNIIHWAYVVVVTRADILISEKKLSNFSSLLKVIEKVFGKETNVAFVENYVYDVEEINKTSKLQQEANLYEIQAKENPNSATARSLEDSFSKFKGKCQHWSKMNGTIIDITHVLFNASSYIVEKRSNNYSDELTDLEEFTDTENDDERPPKDESF